MELREVRDTSATRRKEAHAWDEVILHAGREGSITPKLTGGHHVRSPSPTTCGNLDSIRSSASQRRILTICVQSVEGTGFMTEGHQDAGLWKVPFASVNAGGNWLAIRSDCRILFRKVANALQFGAVLLMWVNDADRQF